MHQFIVSMERIAAQCVYAGRNRFDSFAPLRVNVAAQWLVDGVSRVPPMNWMLGTCTDGCGCSEITSGI
jgi:hypothetical protein